MTRCYRFDSLGCPDLRGAGRTVTIEDGAIVDDLGSRAAVVVRVDARAERALLATLAVSPISVWSEDAAPVVRRELEAGWVGEERTRLATLAVEVE